MICPRSIVQPLEPTLTVSGDVLRKSVNLWGSCPRHPLPLLTQSLRHRVPWHPFLPVGLILFLFLPHPFLSFKDRALSCTPGWFGAHYGYGAQAGFSSARIIGKHPTCLHAYGHDCGTLQVSIAWHMKQSEGTRVQPAF